MTGTTNTLGLSNVGEITYDVDFDDAGAGTWSLTGSDTRESMRGPVVSHIYESPGTYNVEVVARSADGGCDSETATITVTDPDTVFSGTNTVCVSTSGTFTGCPAGATQTTSSDFDATFQTAAGKRTLYRRGETFDASAQKAIATSTDRVGVFGAGSSRAIVNVTHSSDPVISFNAAIPATDWAIWGLEFQSLAAGQTAFGKTNAGQLQNITFYDNKTVGGTLLTMGDQLHSGIGIFGNDTSLCDGSTGSNCIFVTGDPLMIVGNKLDDSSAAEHVLRIAQARRASIASNIAQTPAHLTGAKHALKFQADGGAGNESEYFNIYRNYFKGKASSSIPIDIGPQNSLEDERVRYGVIDSNYIENIDANNGCMRLATEGNIWVRNNVCEMGSDNTGFLVGKNGSMPSVTQTNHFFANNTCRSSGVASPICVSSGGSSAQREAINTIILSNDAGADAAGSTWDVESGSTVKTLSSNPFVTNPPTTWAEYEFANGGSADTTGTTADGVRYDYEGTERPASPNVGHDEPN
jgi:hypothetical protein